MNIKLLAFFNAASCLVYVACFFLNRRACHNAALLSGTLEVISHTFLAVIYLGWDSGFHYYLLYLAPLIFFSSTLSNKAKITLTSITCALYIGLNHYTHYSNPLHKVADDTLDIVNYFIIITVFMLFSFLAYLFSLASIKTEHQLKKANKKLEVLAGTDPLTGLLNRRRILEEIQNHMVQYQRDGNPFVLILGDIDGFKPFNDRHGHDCGDFILTSVSALMKKALRKNDHIARWGGEEFMLLLPETSLENGKAVAEKLRETILRNSFEYEGENLSITITFGISEYEKNLSASTLIKRADQSLYQGKLSGKNCVMS